LSRGGRPCAGPQLSFADVYALHMLKERLQILVSADQRRRLEAEARRRGTSVGSLVREAVDRHLGAVSHADRLAALEGIRATDGRFLSPEELGRIVEDDRDEGLGVVAGPVSR